MHVSTVRSCLDLSCLLFILKYYFFLPNGGGALGSCTPPPTWSYAGAPKWQNNGLLFSYLTFSIYQIAATTSSMSSNEYNSACSLCIRK